MTGSSRNTASFAGAVQKENPLTIQGSGWTAAS